MMNPQCKPRLIAILGPTGVGKTETAIRLASGWCGEIISADSMQVYRMMDIGTAKPSCEERSKIRHHLIDVVDPDESFNAAMYNRMGGEIIETMHSEKKPIFIVGGTGLYIKTLLGGLFRGPEADESLRDFYRQELKCYGKSYLYSKLKEKDGQAAAVIDENDTVRVIRALEVLELSGESIVSKQARHGFGDVKYECLKIGLLMDRDILYDRIDQRTDKMIREGLVEEVAELLDRGYHENLKPMRSLGYKHMVGFIKGLSRLEEAIRMMKQDTKRYAKRQMTWFGADKEVEWMPPYAVDTAKQRIEQFLRRSEIS
jgi:tRNA dimethylallyltransferase